MSLTEVATISQRPSLVAKFAAKFSVDPAKMMATLKATCFKGNVSDEQMMSLLVVADQYDLNPWTKEVYAFPDKNNGIVPVVGVDGWARIMNSHPAFNGIEFIEGEDDAQGKPTWTEAVIHRKDRTVPIRVREYFREVGRGTGPWQSHPRRMLRHKAMIQCARLAFSFAGIYDEDEAQRIIEATDAVVVSSKPVTRAPRPRQVEHVEDAVPDAADAMTVQENGDAMRAALLARADGEEPGANG